MDCYKTDIIKKGKLFFLFRFRDRIRIFSIMFGYPMLKKGIQTLRSFHHYFSFPPTVRLLQHLPFFHLPTLLFFILLTLLYLPPPCPFFSPSHIPPYVHIEMGKTNLGQFVLDSHLGAQQQINAIIDLNAKNKMRHLATML